MEEEIKPKHPYKIEIGDEIMVFRNEYSGYVYYKAMIQKKNYDNTKDIFYKPLYFRKGVNLEDRTIIKIKDMFEDVRKNPKDKYTPIWSLFILDFDIMPNQVKDKSSAIEEYNNQVNSVDIDDVFADVAISDDDLPF
jgi:hypothetical protein